MRLKLLFIPVLSLFIVSCSMQSKVESADENKTIPVIRLMPGKAEINREYVGNIEAVRNVEIYARVKGYLEQVYVDEGKYVKKGQLLFKINDGEYTTSLAKVKANLAYAIAESKEMELEVERMKNLVTKQVISKTELDVAKARMDAAKAKVEEAKSTVDHATIQLNNTCIYAPFDGIVDRIPYKPGSLIDEGTRLTSLSDVNEIYVYFNVSETEYLQYKKSSSQRKNDEVELLLADGSEFPEKGKVETMEGQFNETTGSIAFRAKFSNPDKILKHGSTGTIRLTGILATALLVPHKACLEIQDKNFVFVLDDEHKVKMRSFTPAFRLSGSYLVKSGLKPGDIIVYEGAQSLRDGMKISPKHIESPVATQNHLD